MVRLGAEIVDFGAESTRPGSTELDVDEELARLLPAIEGFRAVSDAVISVDTRHPEVAEAALRAGADIVNDIEALARPGMADIVARAEAAVVLMHMQGTPQTMQHAPLYTDCLGEVYSFLEKAAEHALETGIAQEAIIIDPGIGFGKLKEHNLVLLKGIDRLKNLGYPVLIGVSAQTPHRRADGKGCPRTPCGQPRRGACCVAQRRRHHSRARCGPDHRHTSRLSGGRAMNAPALLDF